MRFKKLFIFFSLLFFHTILLADTLIIEPNEGRAPILSAIEQAKHSIDLVDYGLTDPAIIAALIQAKHAGIKLKLSKKLIIHAKIIIIDDQLAILGSINLTKNSLEHNRELAILITDPIIIKQLALTFEYDWNHTKIARHPVKKIKLQSSMAIVF